MDLHLTEEQMRRLESLSKGEGLTVEEMASRLLSGEMARRFSKPAKTGNVKPFSGPQKVKTEALNGT